MKRPWRTLGIALLTVPAALTGLLVGSVAVTPLPAAAAPITLPDLQVLVPTSDISIGTNPDTGHRQLQFTHITWDSGPGPFAFKPKYNATTGLSTLVQEIYNSPLPGVWKPDHSVPVPLPGIFDRPSDLRFPLTRFTLNVANPDGTPGALVAVSPKVDYCITADTYVGGVPHTPAATYPPQADCTNPNALLGFSVGWGDEYDQTDNGQPIDLTGIPDGTYVLHAVVDPQHVFQEINTTDNVVDTELQISGSSVTVLSQTTPVTVPPTISITSPTAGSTVVGTVTLQSNPVATAPASVASVQYLLDGQPLGPPVTTAPYDLNWTVGITAPGTHTLCAQVTDTNGNVGTAPAQTITVGHGSGGGFALDASAYKIGHGSLTSTLLSTTQPGDTLLAFVSQDGPAGAGLQTATVSGAGLAWHLVARENNQWGDAEIWSATAPTVLTGVAVRSHQNRATYAQQLTVLAFSGAAGVGATSVASGPSGAPGTSLTTTAAGSLTFGVGADWDNAIARTLDSDQSMVKQWVDSIDGDTFWVQGSFAPAGPAGQTVTLGDTAPTTDQWNMAAVEVVPTAAPPPAVALIDPAKGETVSGTTPLAALPSDAVAVHSVKFLVDGTPVGQGTPRSHFAFHWNTAHVSNGTHMLETVLTDAQGRTVSSEVPVTVANPTPPMTCFVLQARTEAHGSGTVETPAIHTASADEQLMAFVATSGTSANPTVKGDGLDWQLVKRASTDGHQVSIWAAAAPKVMSGVRVTSVLSSGTQDVSLMAIEGTDGLGAAVAASGGALSAPGFSLTTTKPVSLVFAVGVGGSGSAAVPAGWSRLSADVSTADASWVDYTNQPVNTPGTTVTFTTGAVGASWAVAALELPGDGA